MTALKRITANRMIAANGQTVTLTRRAAGAYNPATGSAAAITPTTQTGKGVILPLAPMRKNGDSIVEGDQQLLLSALTSTGGVLALPHVNDTVTLADASVLTIIAVEPLTPAGLDILYDCIVRRAG